MVVNELLKKILAKFTEKGFACYCNFSTDLAVSIAAGPATEFVEGASYFILPLLVGYETDAKKIGEHIVSSCIDQPRIRIMSPVVVEHIFGDEHTDTSMFYPGDEVLLNGFRLEDVAISVISECGKFDMSYNQFLMGIDIIPKLDRVR